MKNQQEQKRTFFTIGNQWANSVFANYSIIKQRILLELLQESQPYIKQVKGGIRVTDVYSIIDGKKQPFFDGKNKWFTLDLSKITRYNNYHHVRTALTEMCEQSVYWYDDPSWGTNNPNYATFPLLHTWEKTDKPRYVRIGIKRLVWEKMFYVARKNNTAEHFTNMDLDTLMYGSCKSHMYVNSKYVLPLYMLIRSYTSAGGFRMGYKDFCARMQLSGTWCRTDEAGEPVAGNKYNSFYHFAKNVLDHVQAELKVYGKYTFNYDVERDGRCIKYIRIKVIKTKPKEQEDHEWVRLQQYVNNGSQWFRRFTPDQHAQFNYLLQGQYSLDDVFQKFKYIDGELTKFKAAGVPRRSPFHYTLTSIQRAFPPPE